MSQKFKIILFLFVFVLPSLLQAQDIHFTQYSFVPSLQNAATTGLMKQDYRLSTLYRNQWFSVPVNYNSIGFSFDANFLENYKTGSKAGYGLSFYFDQAGDSKLQTLNLILPIAYHFFIPIKKNTLKFSVAIEAGFQYKSLSTSELFYDSQFNGELFDPTANNLEDFSNLNILNPDIGFGFNLEYEAQNNLRIGLGFSVKHLNNITEAFLANNIRPTLRKRYTLPLYAQIPINNKWDIHLSYLLNEQNKSQEHISGVLASYYLENIGIYQRKINFGAFYRVADAPSIAIQYETNNYKFGISYDITSSNFRKASNTYGGVELAGTYLINTIKKPKAKRKCFTF